MKTYRQKIDVGDLVSHYLHPLSWLALVLDLKHEGPGFFEGELKARVKIVPGTRHTSYFRNESGIGWVYRKWLWIPGADKYEFSELEAIYDSKKRDT